MPKRDMGLSGESSVASVGELPSSLTRADFGLFAGTVPLGRKKPRSRTSSYHGVYASTKCLGPADFQSLLERDFQTVLCCDPRVEIYAVQAHRLTYWVPNTAGTATQRLYTPDFVVRLRDGRIVVIEVKAEALERQSYWQERGPYIQLAYARDYAVDFLVITERHIRIQPRLSNLERMLHFGARFDDPEAVMRVRDAFALSSARPKIGELCELTVLASERMSRSYSALMQLALRGEIELDLDQPLSLSTTIAKVPV